VRASDPRVHYKRKLAQGFVGVIAGGGLLAAGVVTHRVYFEAAGAALAVLSLVWAVVCWRRHAARVRPARLKAVKAQGSQGNRPGPGRQRQTRRARMMERMEERWRRRQEGDRRM
jgi:ribosomal protein L19E